MTTQPTLLFSAFFALLAAGIYTYVGWRLSRRVVPSSGAQLAWGSFTVWWYGLAATTSVSAFLSLLGAVGITNLPLFVTAMYINLLIICLALCGLLYYLIYLFMGNSRSLILLAIFYLVYYILLVYYITASNPTDVYIGRWNTELVFHSRLTGPFFVIILLLLLLPQIIGGLAYFTLYYRVTDTTQKYRILLVSWSIIIWFLSPLIARLGGLAEQDWWQLTSRFIGLAAALSILMAYLPPRWLKRRYGILSLNDENQQT